MTGQHVYVHVLIEVYKLAQVEIRLLPRSHG